MINFFKTYILPGLIFQSVVIGGGYATGRELIEFFAQSGPIGGILGMLVAAAIFGVVLAVSFEFARVTRAYNYRTFCRSLLGRGWVAFELCYFIQLLLVLAVIGSAAGNITSVTFGVPAIAGTLVLMALIGLLTFNGSGVIKTVLAAWSLLLYGVYFLLFLLAFTMLGKEIAMTYDQSEVGEGWIQAGVSYSGYNLAVIPAVLFAIGGLKKRRETIGAGLFAGVIAIVPAVIFYVAMMGLYPEIGEEAVPAMYLMSALGIPWLALIFQVIVFGTFVETGAAMLHAVNERLESAFLERNSHLPRLARSVVALCFLGVAVFAAETIGIVALIAKGYAALTIAIIGVLIFPVLTIGVWKIARSHSADLR